MTGAINAAKGFAGDVFSGIGNGLEGLAGGIQGLFNSGNQPMAGGADATNAALSQGVTDLPDVSGGANPGTMTAGAFAGPHGMGAGADDSLSTMLAAMNGGAPSTSRDISTVAGSGGGGAGAGDFNWGQFLTKTALPAGLLAYTIYRGNQSPPEVDAMNRLARNAEQQSAAYGAGAAAAMQGQLPGGAQASIDQALEAVRARIRSNYAALGMTGSSPEAQDLAYAELAATAQAFQIGQSMATQGFQAAAGADSLSASLYQAILQAETARGTALGDALAEFAAGLVDPGATVGGGG